MESLQQQKLTSARWISVLAAFAAIALWLIVLACAFGISGQDYRHDVEEHGATAAALMTAGKIAGHLAIVLIMMQYVLSARFKIMDQLFGLDRLFKVHAALGLLAVILASTHPFLVFAPAFNTLGAFRPEIGDELIGAGVLILLWLVVVTSMARGFLKLPYHIWRWSHLLVFVIALFGLIHAFEMEDELHEGAGLVFWILMIGAYVSIFVWVKFIRPGQLKKRLFTVKEMVQLNHNCYQMTLHGPDGKLFGHLPGQFAFVKMAKSPIGREEHPFTISSSPAKGTDLSFTIKASGDYTNKITNIRLGDTATIDGPYGRFSYTLSAANRNLLLIAGGVGITPFLSMLDQLARHNDPRHITLIWANRTQEDLFLNEQFEQFKQQLPHFRMLCVFSREEVPGYPAGRIDQAMLETLLEKEDRKAEVFLCGPPAMMASAQCNLRKMKFPYRRIHTERFSL